MSNFKKYLKIIQEQELNNEKQIENNTQEISILKTINPNEIKTWGDLKKILNGIIEVKKNQKIKDAIKGAAIDLLSDTIPGGSLIKNTYQIIKSMYFSPDDKKTNSVLDKLNIRDNISKTIDDGVENNFLIFFYNYIKSKPDDEIIDMNGFSMTNELNKFLVSNYNVYMKNK